MAESRAGLWCAARHLNTMPQAPVGSATYDHQERVPSSAQGTLRARIDAMASMPLHHSSTDLPARRSPTSVRPSQVRQVLSQAALHMHLPDSRMTAQGSGPEYDRLRSTLKQLKTDARDGLGAVGAQLAMESETSRVVEHVNASVRSVQRAFGVLADTLEDEVGNLRAADAQQWEQLKVHASQFQTVEELKAELERTRTELRAAQVALSTFKTDEHAVIVRKVDELAEQLAEQREQISSMQKAHTAERNRLVEEVASLRRWRTDVASPFIETAGRAVANHEQQLERTLPALQKLVEEIDGRTAKHIPELLHAAEASGRRQQYLEEEGARTAAQLARLGESHTEAAARMEERLRLFRDESRTEAESHELRLRQAAAELEAHAEAIKTVGAEVAKSRAEAREEADTLAAGVRNVQVALTESKEKFDRMDAALQSDVRELKESSEAASVREAQTLEGVLNLRTTQNQVSAWMEHVQRELNAVKNEGSRHAETLRDVTSEVEAGKAMRNAWRDELSVIDGKLSDAMRVVDAHSAERQHIREIGESMEVFKREVRATFEATQHAHNRLRELVDERRSSTGGGGGGDRDRDRGVWTSSGAAAARELEATQHAQRRAEDLSGFANRGLHGTGLQSGMTPARVGFALVAEEPDTIRQGSRSANADADAQPRPRHAWDADFEPPARAPAPSDAALAAARSPPISRGAGASAFTPSLWMTPAASRSANFAASLTFPSPGPSRLGLGGVTPALSRGQPRRGSP